MSDDPYVWPHSDTLRNRLGLTDAAMLDRFERELVTQRMAEGCPGGDFDLKHLQAIHQHLFQDVYDWAGQIRTVEINKGGSQFQYRQYIEMGMGDVHRRLEQADYLRGLDAGTFAAKAGEIIGDVNYVHPFREGNGRTQLEYLRQLGEQAGHPLDPGRFDPQRWQEASRAAHLHDFAPMANVIREEISAFPGREREERSDNWSDRYAAARRAEYERNRDRSRDR